MSKTVALTTLSAAPAYENNPFMENAQLLDLKTTGRVARSRAKPGEIFLPATGETIGKCDGFYSRKEVDAEQFIKLYLDGTGHLSRMTPSGLAVFQALYVLMLPQHGKDQINVTQQLAEKRFGITRSTYFRGMSDLLHAGFIAKSDIQGIFWINPAFIFNGDRLRFVKDYDRKETRAELLAAGVRLERKENAQLTIKGKAGDPDQIDIEQAINDSKDAER